MDVIKTEPEVDPLVIETSDNTDTDQKKLFSEKRILLDVDMTRIKMESMDNSDDLKLEMAFEQTAMPTDISIVKTGVEEGLFDLDRLQQEQKVEVSSEEDEVFSEI
ncbi:uncharacterized protein [Periplaneta americana]|uniref:uncharacterized protein isoform X3 n=1 Tax=Periplaneta americana TaxID=6978 RepID=UPI0037E8EAFD